MNSLERTRLELAEIANVLRAATDGHECLVTFESQKIKVNTSFNPMFYLEDAVSYWTGFFGLKDPFAKPCQETIDYFHRVFGKKRVERVWQTNTLQGPLKKKHIKELFASTGEVLGADLEELFSEIKNTKSKLRYFSLQETEEIKRLFQNQRSLKECSKDQIDLLLSYLLPYRHINDLFLHATPSLNSMNFHCPRGFQSLNKRVLVYETIRQKNVTEDEWVMFLAKTLADREIPEGVILKAPGNSYVVVHKTVSGAGAYKYFLKTIASQTQDASNYIVYRGTSPFPTATESFQTLIEDFRYKIGDRGPQETFEKTKDLLEKPELGFIDQKGQKITAIGMSLGGAHAMRDMIFHPITRLITVASPGIDKESSRIFSRQVNSKVRTGLKIEHHFEAEDIFDQFGDEHLGAGCDRDKIEVKVKIHEPLVSAKTFESKEASLKDQLERIAKMRKVFTTYAWQQLVPEPIVNFLRFSNIPKWVFSIPEAGLRLLQSIVDVHMRNTLSMPCKTLEITNSVQHKVLESLVDHSSQLFDQRWEKLRKIIPNTLAKF